MVKKRNVFFKKQSDGGKEEKNNFPVKEEHGIVHP
jgi:hypothetical protein